MRALADADRIRRFMTALAAESREDGRVYFTGGATAVLLAWRDSTIDVDLRLVPEQDLLLRAIPRLKEVLQLNVELDPAQRGVAERHVDRDGDIIVVAWTAVLLAHGHDQPEEPALSVANGSGGRGV